MNPGLVGGFNPFEKYCSNWIISPGIGVKLKNMSSPIPHQPAEAVEKKNIWNFPPADALWCMLTQTNFAPLKCPWTQGHWVIALHQFFDQLRDQRQRGGRGWNRWNCRRVRWIRVLAKPRDSNPAGYELHEIHGCFIGILISWFIIIPIISLGSIIPCTR